MMPAEIFCCTDCNKFCATSIGSPCPDCERWRGEKLAQMVEDYLRQEARRARTRMLSGARFGEALAAMAKAVERSRQ